MAKYLITKARLSDMAGVSRMAITKACKPGCRLFDAMEGKHVNAGHPAVVAYLKEKGKSVPSQPKEDPKPKPKPKAKPVRPVSKPKQKPRPKPKPRVKVTSKKPAKPKPSTKNVSPKPEPIKTVQNPDQGAVLSNLESFLQSLPDDLRDDVRNVQHLPFIDVLNLFGSHMQFKGFVEGTKKLEEIYKLQIENKKRANELIDRDILTVVIGIVNGTHNKILRDGTMSMANISERKVKAGISREKLAIELQKNLTKFFAPMKEKLRRKLEELDDAKE